MEPPLGRRLYLAHRAVHDALDDRMGKRGASLWHWILLRQAAEHEGSSQRELATSTTSPSRGWSSGGATNATDGSRGCTSLPRGAAA
jgi:hypothetical protein